MGKTSHHQPPRRRSARLLSSRPKSSSSKSGNVGRKRNPNSTEEEPSPSSVSSPKFKIINLPIVFGKEVDILAEFGPVPVQGVAKHGREEKYKATITQTQMTTHDDDLQLFKARAKNVVNHNGSHRMEFLFENVKFEFMEGIWGLDIRVFRTRKEIYRGLQDLPEETDEQQLVNEQPANEQLPSEEPASNQTKAPCKLTHTYLHSNIRRY